MSIETIIDRQYEISNGNIYDIGLPKHKIYTICNLRGGIGKTTLSFNLSFLTDNLLVVDTCPQGNLSYFYDNNYPLNNQTNVNDILLPYLVPGLGKANNVASYIGATNKYFDSKNNFYIQSSGELYLLPSKLITAISQTSGLNEENRKQAINNIIYSLKKEIERELEEKKLNKCIIDTSPFFSGATQLAWYASDALIIPLRTDQQSINSLELLLRILQHPESEYKKYINDQKSIKIQMIILTHCGWSTVTNAKNRPNQQTKIYIKKIYDIISKYRHLFTTFNNPDDHFNPDDHLFILDDFLGSGRISSIESKPINLLQEGETKTINRVRVVVNKSVDKCKNQLKFISNQLW